MFKYLILFLVLILFTSCDEEEKILVEEDPIEEVEDNEEDVKDKEDEIVTDTILPFKLNSIYPPYAFWESVIRITLDKNEFFDASKLEIYFNEKLLPMVEVNNTGPQFIILTRMISNSESDKFKFKYKSKDTIFNLESDHYEIVNSEVKINSIQSTPCGEYKKVYGKGFRYIDHIAMGIGRTDDPYAVIVKTPYEHPKGVLINDNEAIFKFVQGHNSHFYLSISDNILSPKHPYPTNRSFTLLERNYYNINTPKIRQILRKGQEVFIEAELWFRLENEDIIRFGEIVSIKMI